MVCPPSPMWDVRRCYFQQLSDGGVHDDIMVAVAVASRSKWISSRRKSEAIDTRPAQTSKTPIPLFVRFERPFLWGFFLQRWSASPIIRKRSPPGTYCSTTSQGNKFRRAPRRAADVGAGTMDRARKRANAFFEIWKVRWSPDLWPTGCAYL